ncbi:MAG: hypothetical protein WC667_09065 [Sulfurimonas sp.]
MKNESVILFGLFVLLLVVGVLVIRIDSTLQEVKQELKNGGKNELIFVETNGTNELLEGFGYEKNSTF